jgi:hypothetical protein
MVGSGIRKKPIPDPGSGGQKRTGSRIRIRNTGRKRIFLKKKRGKIKEERKHEDSYINLMQQDKRALRRYVPVGLLGEVECLVLRIKYRLLNRRRICVY